MNQAAVLMSIKPEYAELIFTGLKSIELRRVCPKIDSGDLVLVYASSPRMALIGGFEVERIVSDEPELFFSKYGTESGISKETFDTYFHSARVAYGIAIRRTWKLVDEAELTTLRNVVKGFHPPQSYRYLKANELHGLNNL